jgi:hypothetical protein
MVEGAPFTPVTVRRPLGVGDAALPRFATRLIIQLPIVLPFHKIPLTVHEACE